MREESKMLVYNFVKVLKDMAMIIDTVMSLYKLKIDKELITDCITFNTERIEAEKKVFLNVVYGNLKSAKEDERWNNLVDRTFNKFWGMKLNGKFTDKLEYDVNRLITKLENE